MRNTVISVISIMLIAVYSVISTHFLNGFTEKIENDINFADQNGYTTAVADNLILTLEDNMSVLLFIASKDHIDTLEECIVNIRYAVEYDDMQNVRIYKSLLLKAVDEINRMNKSLL